jgi:hypothetical protein
MKYMLEIDTPTNQIPFVEEVLKTLPFVKTVQPVGGRQKTFADIFGKFKRGIDGLEYQKTMRDEWN